MSDHRYKMSEEQLQQAYHQVPVLVTGGAGFIGSSIVDRLVDLGAQVTVLDDLSSGSLENLILSQDRITFIQGSITSFDDCLRAMPEQAYVFHLAAHVSVPNSMHYPLQCHATNVDGTMHILEAARQKRARGVIFSSSSSVYGDYVDIAYESASCVPISPYGASKYIGEVYCRTYARAYGLPTLCLRYFNVHGKRQNPYGPYAGVVAQFSERMRNHKDLTIYGDGLQKRDFTPVDYVVEANIRVALQEPSLLDGSPVNVGMGKSITILELVDTLKKEYPAYEGIISFMPEREGDIRFSQADCSALWRLI